LKGDPITENGGEGGRPFLQTGRPGTGQLRGPSGGRVGQVAYAEIHSQRPTEATGREPNTNGQKTERKKLRRGEETSGTNSQDNIQRGVISGKRERKRCSSRSKEKNGHKRGQQRPPGLGLHVKGGELVNKLTARTLVCSNRGGATKATIWSSVG